MAKKILIIEDEYFISDLYKMQLEKAGFLVDVSAMGNDGILKLKTNNYDLILLDIMLPDINGIEVLKKIKADDATKSIPIVLLTNLAQDEIIKEGFVQGAQGYLIKAQHEPDQVVEEVKNILGSIATSQS